MPEAKAVGFSSSKPARLVFSGLVFKRGFPPSFRRVSSILSFKKIRFRLILYGFYRVSRYGIEFEICLKARELY